MKALRIALVLCLGGFFPVFLLCFGTDRLCPGAGCPGGTDSISCRKVCVNQTPAPTNPPQEPIPAPPTSTPALLLPPPEDSNCEVNPLNGVLTEDNCGDSWDPYVAPVTIDDGSTIYICACNSPQPPAGGGGLGGGGYCLLKNGPDGKPTNVLQINGCYQGFSPYIGRYGDIWYCKCVN